MNNSTDTMRFICTQCGFDFSLPVPDVMKCEDHLHCPSCGASMEKINFIENKNNKNVAWVQNKDDKFYKIQN